MSTPLSAYKYAGSELELFAAARNWKSYWSAEIRAYLRGDILEVGAGIGSNTLVMDPGGAGRWVCLEPDPGMCAEIANTVAGGAVRRRYEFRCGTLESVTEVFDTIVYIDVLEHIEADAAELVLAASRLRAGGHVIVLSPAQQWLFSPFDAAIGHYRRYDKAMMRAVTPRGTRLARLRYLDCAGLFLSAANAMLLRQAMPTKAQIGVWDGWVVPVSRVLDPLLFYGVGKTIVGIWEKQGGA